MSTIVAFLLLVVFFTAVAVAGMILFESVRNYREGKKIVDSFPQESQIPTLEQTAMLGLSAQLEKDLFAPDPNCLCPGCQNAPSGLGHAYEEFYDGETVAVEDPRVSGFEFQPVEKVKKAKKKKSKKKAKKKTAKKTKKK